MFDGGATNTTFESVDYAPYRTPATRPNPADLFESSAYVGSARPNIVGEAEHMLVASTDKVAVLRAAIFGDLATFAASTSPDIEDAATDVDALLASINKSSRFPFRQEIASRLSRLRSMALDEPGEDGSFDIRSLQGLIGFLKSARLKRPPQIALTDEGTFTAEWDFATDRMLILHFVSGGSVNFAIVKPATGAPGKTITMYGNAPIGSLGSVFSDIGAAAWI